MSDLKAKAEARRAKILARDSASKRTVSAVMDIPEEVEVSRISILSFFIRLMTNDVQDLNLQIGPTTPKERPLAARRRLVNKDDSESTSVSEKVRSEGSEETDAPSSSSVTESKEDSKTAELKLPPKKTLEEIEREVAENTANFDENTLGKTKEDNTTTTDEKKQQLETVVQKVVQKSILDGPALMRIVRLLFIVTMAFYSG